MSERLVAYCWSLSPYFNDPTSANPGLLRLKMMELLYNVMDCSKNIFRQMLQLRQPVKTDIHRVSSSTAHHHQHLVIANSYRKVR